MPRSKANHEPLSIIVSDGQWNAYGDPANRRHIFLQKVLVKMGGISDSVPNGLYYFDAHRNGFKLEVELTPQS